MPNSTVQVFIVSTIIKWGECWMYVRICTSHDMNIVNLNDNANTLIIVLIS